MKAYRQVKIYTFNDGTQLLEESGSLPNPSSADLMKRIGTEESLQDISFNEYGNHEEWVTIAYSNGIINPWDSLTNQVLVIPNVN
jgi:hypothetical protein